MAKGRYIDLRKPGTAWKASSLRWVEDEQTDTDNITDGGETGTSPSGDTSAEATSKGLFKRSSSRSVSDLRRPGVAWSPAHLAQADRRAVPQEGAARHRRSSEEAAARAHLEATIKALFGDVERRGAHALKEREGA